METTISSILTGMGTTGLGFLFLWIFMKQYFKHMDAITENLNAIAVETRMLASKVDNLQTAQMLQQEIDRQHSGKVDGIRDEIAKIYMMVTELLTESHKIPFGEVAIIKELLTREQVAEILNAQTDLSKRS